MFVHVDTCTKLQIGLITHQKTKSLLDEGHVADRQVSTFYTGVRAFFERAMEYSIQNLPLNDVLLQNASFLNFEQRMNADALQPEYFVSICVLPMNVFFLKEGSQLASMTIFFDKPTWRKMKQNSANISASILWRKLGYTSQNIGTILFHLISCWFIEIVMNVFVTYIFINNKLYRYSQLLPFNSSTELTKLSEELWNINYFQGKIFLTQYGMKLVSNKVKREMSTLTIV